MVKTAVICILSVSLLAACTRHQEEIKYPVFGKDAIEDVSAMEEQSRALVRWLDKGIKNAVLIHVSPQDALGAISPEKARTIGKMVQKQRITELDGGRGKLYDDSNYLTAAVQAGIVKEIYWVLPYKFFGDIPLAREKIADFLKSERKWLKEEEVANMRMVAGCLTGLVSGADMHICSPRTLPQVIAPVIISMDVSFISVYDAEEGTSKLRALKRFFDFMGLKKAFHVIHADISYGVEGGTTAVIHRYIGDQLIEVMGNPQIIMAESPPELWQHWDMAENMYSGGEDSLVVEYLEEPLGKYPDDLPLRLLNAAATARLKKFDDVLNEIDELCAKDRYYCYGFVYLSEGMGPDEAQWKEKFLNRAGETLPDSLRVKQAVLQTSDISSRK